MPTTANHEIADLRENEGERLLNRLTGEAKAVAEFAIETAMRARGDSFSHVARH